MPHQRKIKTKWLRRIAISTLFLLLTACSSLPTIEVDDSNLLYKEIKKKITSKKYSKAALQIILADVISLADKLDTRPHMKLLLEHGADINDQTSTEKLTALMLACKKSNTPAYIFDFLLENGANINLSIPIKSALRPGATALHLCAGIDYIYFGAAKNTLGYQHGNSAGYKILIAHDANKFIKDKKGISANSTLITLKKGALEKLLAASSNKHQQQQKLVDAAERKKKAITTWNRDLYLPFKLRQNKYFSAINNRLNEKRYADALVYFDFLKRMKIELPHRYIYFHGEALLMSEKPQQALTALLRYINFTKAKGARYKKAIKLIDKAKILINP